MQREPDLLDAAFATVIPEQPLLAIEDRIRLVNGVVVPLVLTRPDNGWLDPRKCAPCGRVQPRHSASQIPFAASLSEHFHPSNRDIVSLSLDNLRIASVSISLIRSGGNLKMRPISSTLTKLSYAPGYWK